MISKIFFTLSICIAFGAAQSIQKAVEGESCNPEECQEEGYCLHYFTCNNVTLVWDKRFCGEELMWNERANSNHGGTCDAISGIDKDIMDGYIADPECIKPCAWGQEDDQVCTGAYWYREKFNGVLNNRVHQLTCPSGLTWSQGNTTCDHCVNVVDKDLKPCNCGAQPIPLPPQP